MATVNCDSLRNEFDAKKADIDSHLKNGEITEDAYKSITGVYDMMEVMMAIFLPPFHREVRHLQVVEIVVKNFSMMGCDQGATTPSYWAGRLA